MEVNFRNYFILFVIVLTSVYFGSQLKKTNETLERKEDEELIQKYLLNETKAVEVKKVERPKLWIHTKYDLNARKWDSFGSRTSKNLNQPYLHLTIKSIIQHCGNDFHICLIDDDSFQHLIPDWVVPLNTLNGNFIKRAREYGIARLLHLYGGMVIPNSFVCLRNLMPLYKETLALGSGAPFVCENINHFANINHNEKRLLFAPDSFIMGCNKGDTVIGKWIDFLMANSGHHFQSQTDFLGDSSQWFMKAIEQRQMTLMDGMKVGVKTSKKQAIIIDHLIESGPLDLDDDCYGIYIPADELLSRPKLEWYAVLSIEELLKSKPIITKYLIQAVYTSYMDDLGISGPDSIKSMKLSYIIPSQVGGGGI